MGRAVSGAEWQGQYIFSMRDARALAISFLIIVLLMRSLFQWQAKTAACESYVTQLLIVYHELLFAVPNALLEQLRFLTDAEAGTSKKAKNVKEVRMKPLVFFCCTAWI